MAEPNDVTQEQDETSLSAADRAFLEHMGQGKGKGYAKGWRGETGEPLVSQALELKSIGRRFTTCLLYTSPSPRDQRGSRMPSSA